MEGPAHPMADRVKIECNILTKQHIKVRGDVIKHKKEDSEKSQMGGGSPNFNLGNSKFPRGVLNLEKCLDRKSLSNHIRKQKIKTLNLVL